MTKTELVRKEFKSEFHADPLMVFSPGRINLIGEHTDYNNGFVLPGAINLGFSVAIGESKTTASKVIALDKSEALTIDLESINRIDEGGWKNYVLGLLKEFQKTKKLQNFNMVFGSDLPEGGGLSSSAAMLNGIGMAINILQNLNFSKKDLIMASQATEHNYVGLECGIMDQFASMFGQKDHLIFLDCSSLKSEIIPFKLDEYELILINTNIKHNLAETAYNDRKKVCTLMANRFNQNSLRRVTTDEIDSIKSKIDHDQMLMVKYVFQENGRVQDAVVAIKEKDYSRLGNLMYASHEGLKTQYMVSCSELDFLVDQAKKYQFSGSRMMGGGFGGCTINLVKKGKFDEYQDAIKKAYFEKFNIPCSIYRLTLSEGTHQIH